MIKWFLSLFSAKEKPIKMVMIWNGKEVQNWSLTKSQYEKLMRIALPFGVSIISEMDI